MKVMGLVAVLLALASIASAQEPSHLSGWVEAQGTVANGSITPQTNLSLSYKLSEKAGLFLWAQTSEEYSQVYAGPTWTPKPYLQLGAGVGVEQAKSSARVGGFVWAGKGPVSTLLIMEHGGSGFWYKNQTDLTLKKGVTLGFQSQRFAGNGVHVEFQIPETHFTAWGSVLGQRDGQTIQVGVRYSF